MNLPFTTRFFATKDPARLNIKGEPDAVLDIWYRNNSDNPKHFGHTWQIHEGAPEDEGKWTFNRSTVAIENEYWPPIYQHDTLQELLDHLEGTYPIERVLPLGDYP